MKKIIILISVMISVFVACSSQSTDNSFEARGYSSTDKLVSAEWLEENINDVKIIDVRKQEDYEQGHIPGALRLTQNDVFEWEDDNERLSKWAEFRKDPELATAFAKSEVK